MTPYEGSDTTVEVSGHPPTTAPPASPAMTGLSLDMPARTTAARGSALVVLAALCWGTSGITGDVVADRTDLDPLDVAWHRMAIGDSAAVA